MIKFVHNTNSAYFVSKFIGFVGSTFTHSPKAKREESHETMKEAIPPMFIGLGAF